MTFNPLAGKLIAKIAGGFDCGSSVVELGNQTFTVSDTIMKQVACWAGKRLDKDKLEKICSLEADARLEKVKEYYNALGFKKYTAIDVNDKYGSISMDLNHDLKKHYGFEKEFDLVTNNGTGEHIFDQAMIFKNMHQLAREGGLMLHVMPFVHWENHGFYNFNPILYVDVSVANEYDIIRLSLANRWGDEVLVLCDDSTNERTQVSREKREGDYSFLKSLPGASSLVRLKQHLQVVIRSWRNDGTLSVNDFCENIKYPGKGINLATAIRRLQRSRWDNILVTALMRKKRNDAFRYPIQGKYFSDIKEVSIEKNYA